MFYVSFYIIEHIGTWGNSSKFNKSHCPCKTHLVNQAWNLYFPENIEVCAFWVVTKTNKSYILILQACNSVAQTCGHPSTLPN